MKPGLIIICAALATSGCMQVSHLIGPAAPDPKSIQWELVPNNPKLGEELRMSITDAPPGKYIISVSKLDDPNYRVFIKEYTTAAASSSCSIALTNPLGVTEKGEDFVLEYGVQYLVDVRIQSGNIVRNPAFPFKIRGPAE